MNNGRAFGLSGEPLPADYKVEAPKPCPVCRLLKQGDGLLCTVCHREAEALRRQIEEDNRK